MFKRKDVQRFFENKLECDPCEGRHTEYLLRTQGRKIALPFVLTLSRSSGDVPSGNIKGLASDLGLSNKGFELGVRCPVRRGCVLLCVAARFLGFVIDRYQRDPIAHNEEELERAKESVGFILADVEKNVTATSWDAPELKELARAEFQVRRGTAVPTLKSSSEKWLTLARSGVK